MNDALNYPYTHPITIRYADLDSHGHVNNASILTYLESARLGYYQAVGIWCPSHGMHTGIVVAHIDIDYLKPIFFDTEIYVGLKLADLGNKSFTLMFSVETVYNHLLLARGTTVMVTFDNNTNTSIPVPQEWRNKLLQFEHRKG